MDKITISDASRYSRSLSARESRMLSAWERERRVVATLKDVREQVGMAAAPDVIRNLVRKQVLQRLRPGTYLVRPFRSLGRPTQPSTVVAIEALLQQEPHYLGGLWALAHHGLSEQSYTSIFDVFVTHRLASRQFGAGRVRFHVLTGELFDYGLTTSTIEGMNVHLSDLERTVLDTLDHPRLVGGVSHALKLLGPHFGQTDPKRLMKYAIAGSTANTCQRVGVLLERQGVSSRALSKLKSRARETKSLLSMNPEAPRTGPVNKNWNVVENDL